MTQFLQNFDFEILSPFGRIAFGSSCCERLLPNYEAFAFLENVGDAQVLREILDRIWEVAESGDEKCLEIDLEEMDKLAPDTEQFQSIFSSLAGDCVAALIYTIEAAKEGEAKKLELVQQVVENSVYLYLSTLNDPIPGVHAADPSFDTQVTTFPLWVREASLQQQDFALLKGHQLIPSDVIRQLRDRSAKAGIQPRLRGLIP